METDDKYRLLDTLTWQAPEAYTHAELPSQTRVWLLVSGSMSQRLSWVSGYDVKVRLLDQNWYCPNESEALRLGIDGEKEAMVREVELLCGGKVWMYARSVFPSTELDETGRKFFTLGTRLLGEMLFSDPNVQRSTFEIAMLSEKEKSGKTDMLLQNLFSPAEIARRSVFTITGQTMLLTEWFSPICVMALNASF